MLKRVLVFFLFLVLISFAFLYFKSLNLKFPFDKTETPVYINPSESYEDVLLDTDQTSENGYIEGSLNYPSSGIPDNLFVCAQSLDNLEDVYCTYNQLEDAMYQYGLGYQLEVPVGDYHVYAQTADSDYKAYYSDFVTCGLSVECSSHKPITIAVKSGETNWADPHDWYNTPM